MFPNFPENNKDDDFLNEFRQKLNDQSIANFEEKKNEINRSKNVFIGAVSGIALAAVVGWFVLSPRYANDPNVELPVIRRPQTAVKVQPTEPGGMEILNQDKSVYDIIERKTITLRWLKTCFLLPKSLSSRLLPLSRNLLRLRHRRLPSRIPPQSFWKRLKE